MWTGPRRWEVLFAIFILAIALMPERGTNIIVVGYMAVGSTLAWALALVLLAPHWARAVIRYLKPRWRVAAIIYTMAIVTLAEFGAKIGTEVWLATFSAAAIVSALVLVVPAWGQTLLMGFRALARLWRRPGTDISRS